MEEELRIMEEERQHLEAQHIEDQKKQEEQAKIKEDLKKQLAKDEEERLKLVEQCIAAEKEE